MKIVVTIRTYDRPPICACLLTVPVLVLLVSFALTFVVHGLDANQVPASTISFLDNYFSRRGPISCSAIEQNRRKDISIMQNLVQVVLDLMVSTEHCRSHSPATEAVKFSLGSRRWDLRHEYIILMGAPHLADVDVGPDLRTPRIFFKRVLNQEKTRSMQRGSSSSVTNQNCTPSRVF